MAGRKRVDLLSEKNGPHCRQMTSPASEVGQYHAKRKSQELRLIRSLQAEVEKCKKEKAAFMLR